MASISPPGGACPAPGAWTDGGSTPGRRNALRSRARLGYKPTMSNLRRTVAVLAFLLPLASAAWAAPDCDGGSLLGLRLTATGLRLDGTISRPGVHHGTLLGTNAFHFELSAADDPATILYAATIPADRFMTRGSYTLYDRLGSFSGQVILRDSNKQSDTVIVSIRVAASIVGADVARDVRASFTAGSRCARTCVSSCLLVRGKLRCRASAGYRPFADEGFGGYLKLPRGATSPLCGLAIDTNPACDFLIEERCVLPYPSSFFLRPDPSTPTGLRVSYGPQSLPKNLSNTYVDPTDWNTLDGFSPGPMILALFPDTGFPVAVGPGSNVAFHTNYARSLEADHPVVLVNATTGERIVHFVELDANTTDVTRRALIVRPGRRLDDATRYIVAFRDLVDTLGTPIRPRLAFRAIRDGGTEAEIAAACGSACAAAIVGRRPVFTDVFQRLQANGVDPATLILAWDFTTASTQALTGCIRAVRDQAFALGTPSFAVTSVDDGAGGAGRNANIFRRVQGTFQAPLFMTADAPGSRLNLVGGVPTQNGYATVPCVVDLPRIAVNVGGTPQPARPTLWGHGLLGSRTQVTALSLLANTYDFVVGGVDMQGMSSADLPVVFSLVQNLSQFHFIPERLHQGFLNHLLLGRLLLDPVHGFNSDSAFRFGGVPLIDNTEVYYSGGSQGGIFGVAIMSIAEDFKRGFVAVPGANYSTLLHRSIDFNPYLGLQRTAYPDPLDEEVLLALIQQLWDRAEPQGYMNHLTVGDLSSPPVPHKILIHMATYDSEVSNVSTEIMVRSLGIKQVTPVHRSFFQVAETTAPFDDSAFVEVNPQRKFCNVPGGGPGPGRACTIDADCPGTGDPPSYTFCDPDVPPLTNQAPPYNNGNHGATGSTATGAQIAEFLKPAGQVLQFCAGACDPN